MPSATSSWYRALDSLAVPKPAYCRIVHGRPVYIDGYTPRVNGNSPGAPSAASGLNPSSASGAVDRRERQAGLAASRIAHLTHSFGIEYH